MSDGKFQYIVITEFGDVRFINGSLPSEVVQVADDGDWPRIIGITDPECPLEYVDEGWTDVEKVISE